MDSNISPDPPLGSGPELQLETPLQAVSHLQDAVKNVQELTGELAKSLWEKLTERERNFPQQHFPSAVAELIPAVSAQDLPNVHITPVYLDNSDKVLDVEGYVPREAIIDTGASKSMCSKRFADAMSIDTHQLHRGQQYVTASGAVERPLGITKNKLKFRLGKHTDNICVVELSMTVVDTIAYDVLLGMEFVRAVKGAYDSFTETFTYRTENEIGNLRSTSLSAPCHTITQPLMAYAYFSELVSSSEELHDVQSTFESTIPENEEFGFHTSPLQLAATQL